MSRHPTSQTFHDVLDEMSELHDRKQSDYGRKDDPFANIRASEDFGIDGWVGAIIRANDKMRRLQKAAGGSTLTNETVEDSLLNLAVYAAIGLVLYRETQTVEVGKPGDDPRKGVPVDMGWPDPPTNTAGYDLCNYCGADLTQNTQKPEGWPEPGAAVT